MSERDFKPITSEEKILAAVSALNLTAHANYKNTTKTVATCSLIGPNNVIVSEGAGKGQNCKVGAIAESLEHYLMGHTIRQNMLSASAHEIRSQHLISQDRLLTSLPDTDKQIDCVLMRDIHCGEAVRIPAILQVPDMHLSKKIQSDQTISFLARYSTNSGLAFGCSEQEAILHGLNEVIERDLLSQVLMSVCGRAQKLQLYRPSDEMLARVFSGSLALFSATRNMKIFMTETIYGSYFSMAIPKRPNGRHPICPIGSGCSADPYIAIERSVTELIQALEMFDHSEKKIDLKARDFINKVPFLRPLINLEPLRNIELNSCLFRPATGASVAEQVVHITNKISSAGYRVLLRAVFNFSNRCNVSHVYVPGFERFNLIRSGLPVVPQRHLNIPEILSH